ncbi:MAG TPA: class I SAM-dependent methyltransferase [Allosphingosinicella sp.]|nr:class I SAM-dependent methyltransferase [Allosphingosinicella sp.]
MDDAIETVELEQVACPCCHSTGATYWSEERGYVVVRCDACRFLYVNPRPRMTSIERSVRSGEHLVAGRRINARARRIPRKVNIYKKSLTSLFADRVKSREPLEWVDVGAGYGEIMEAVGQIAPARSRVMGVEPMTHKADVARGLGLEVINGFLEPGRFQADVISAVNIFSHIPDFHSLLTTISSNLKASGEVFIETGNLADLDHRSEAPGILDLPDHLVFSGEAHMLRYLNDAGFELVTIKRVRVDGFTTFAKNLVKRMMGRPAVIGAPYSSRYRQLLIRARRAGTAGGTSEKRMPPNSGNADRQQSSRRGAAS